MQNDHTDHIWQMHMKTLMQRKKQIEIGETIKSAIRDWYLERGITEPQWWVDKDPQWWVDYLKDNEDHERPSI